MLNSKVINVTYAKVMKFITGAQRAMVCQVQMYDFKSSVTWIKDQQSS